jgi:nitroreductase
MNETIENILTRRSVRKYLDKPVSEGDIKTIIKCAIYAPSAKNRQNWHLTVITNKERIEEINKLAIEGMNRLDIVKEEGYHIFYHAPVVIIVSSKIEGFSQINSGCVLENMSIAAKSLGLGSCIIGETRYMYHKADKVDVNRTLKIPEGYEHDAAFIVGYPGEENPEAKPRKDSVVDYMI